jgi:hypothetical protein
MLRELLEIARWAFDHADKLWTLYEIRLAIYRWRLRK